MKKNIVLLLLGVCFGGFAAAQQPLSVNAENLMPEQFQQKAAGDWEVQFNTTLSPKFGYSIGAVSDGSYLYSSCSNAARIYRIGFDHKLVDSIAVTGVPKSSYITGSYITGLAYDGEHMYVTNGGAVIYQLNANYNAVEKTISLPSGTYAAAVTYAPDADNGNGGFWVLFPGREIKLFSRSGSLLSTITASNLGRVTTYMWALAYDTLTEGGPYLYVMENPNSIIRINPATRLICAPVHTVGSEVSAWANSNFYGIYLQKGVADTNKVTLGGFSLDHKHIGYDFATVNQLPELGIHAASTSMAKFIKTNVANTVLATFTTTGQIALNSYVFHYMVDGVECTDTVSGKNLKSYYPGFTLTHAKPYSPVESDKKLTMLLWLSDLNGTALNSDTLSYAFETYERAAQRMVLHEGFTAATCSPCKSGNANLKSIMDANTNWVCIKYQMSWPGNGDPYYTTEGYYRRAYYEISSVPWLRVDGTVYSGNSGSYSASVLRNQAQKPSFVEMSGGLNYDGSKKFTAEIVINPLKDISGDIRLFAALVEVKTVRNIADEYLNQYGMATFSANWDTVFHHVMKKFLTPANSGTAITLRENTPQTIQLEYEFQGDYRLPVNAKDPINHASEHSVENFNNIYMVYWLQDYKTKEVFQAGRSYGGVSISDIRHPETRVKVYPNPASDQMQVCSGTPFTSLRLVNLAGQTVYQESVETSEHSFSVSGLSAGLYILQLQTANGVINTKVQVRR